MVINAKCNDCKEPTKYAVGFFDGRNDIHVAFMVVTTKNAK